MLQGIPAVLLGFVAIFFLPDRPEMTNFLYEDERKIAIERMNRAISGDIGLTVNKCEVVCFLFSCQYFLVDTI